MAKMFLENGKQYSGPVHGMGNGMMMTGATHSAASKMLTTTAPKPTKTKMTKTKDSMAERMAKLRAMRR